jgi:hypothetical protein
MEAAGLSPFTENTTGPGLSRSSTPENVPGAKSLEERKKQMRKAHVKEAARKTAQRTKQGVGRSEDASDEDVSNPRFLPTR